MLFSDEFDLRRDLLCEDGVVLVEYLIRIPTVAVDCPLRRALTAIADRTEAYLKGILADRLRAEYLASGERHKRFTFRRASYRLLCEVRSPSRLIREVTLRRGSRLLHAERVLWDCSETGLYGVLDEASL